MPCLRHTCTTSFVYDISKFEFRNMIDACPDAATAVAAECRRGTGVFRLGWGGGDEATVPDTVVLGS